MKGSSSNVMHASNCHALKDKIRGHKNHLPDSNPILMILVSYDTYTIPLSYAFKKIQSTYHGMRYVLDLRERPIFFQLKLSR